MELGLIWCWRGAHRPLFLPGCRAERWAVPSTWAGRGLLSPEGGLAAGSEDRHWAPQAPPSDTFPPRSARSGVEMGCGVILSQSAGGKALCPFCLDGVSEPCAVAALAPGRLCR